MTTNPTTTTTEASYLDAKALINAAIEETKVDRAAAKKCGDADLVRFNAQRENLRTLERKLDRTHKIAPTCNWMHRDEYVRQLASHATAALTSNLHAYNSWALDCGPKTDEVAEAVIAYALTYKPLNRWTERPLRREEVKHGML
jgi:hypothetical protein